MTRRTLIRSAKERVDRQPEAGVERHRRRVPEDPLRLREIGPGVPEVAGARRLLPAVHRLAEDLADRRRDGVHARGSAGGDVEDLPARTARLTGPHGGVDDVADEREVARLLAVPEHVDRLAGGDPRDEERDCGCVLRHGALPWAEDVEVAKDDALERLVDTREAHAVPLRRELCDAVR